MKNMFNSFLTSKISVLISWVSVVWICKVFLSTLPYKFTNHPETQHIFGTIGIWMQNVLSEGLGSWFIQNGAYTIGIVELLTSLLLLSPLVMMLLKKFNLIQKVPSREFIHGLGGLIAAKVMIGAIFFHLVTPLGIEVLNDGVSDGGSLFYTSVSILILGLLLSAINLPKCFSSLNR